MHKTTVVEICPERLQKHQIMAGENNVVINLFTVSVSTKSASVQNLFKE